MFLINFRQNKCQRYYYRENYKDMGLFSLFQPSNSETTDGYSNLDQSSTSTRYVPNQSYKERKSLSERVEMANGLRVKYPTKIPIIVERFRRVSDDIICFFNLLLIQ